MGNKIQKWKAPSAKSLPAMVSRSSTDSSDSPVRFSRRRSSSLCLERKKKGDFDGVFPRQRIFPDRAASVRESRAAGQGASRFAQSLRGSIHHRKVLRRPSDFSDLQHLQRASDGIKMTDRQKELLRSAYPNEDSENVTRNRRGPMAARLHQRLLKCATENQLQGIRKIFERPLERNNPGVTFVLSPPPSHNAKSPTEDIFSDFCHKRVALHSEKIVEVLDMAISSLDHLDDSLGSYLTDLGARHAKHDLKDNRFSTEYWDLFSQALCDCANSWHIPHDRLETLCAWRIVVFFVVNKMRCGYDVEWERLWFSTPHNVIDTLIEERESLAEVLSIPETGSLNGTRISSVTDSPLT